MIPPKCIPPRLISSLFQELAPIAFTLYESLGRYEQITQGESLHLSYFIVFIYEIAVNYAWTLQSKVYKCTYQADKGHLKLLVLKMKL